MPRTAIGHRQVYLYPPFVRLALFFGSQQPDLDRPTCSLGEARGVSAGAKAHLDSADVMPDKTDVGPLIPPSLTPPSRRHY